MNERIKLLAEQAMSDVQEEAYPEERSWSMDDVMKKFAELIVRECMDQCSYTPNSNDEWDKGVKWAYNQIAQHFGVEE